MAARDDKLPVIADPGSESGAGPIRNPVSVWHWIPDRVRDDNLHVIADLIRNPVSVWHWIPDVETPDLIRGRDDIFGVRDDKPGVRDDKPQPRYRRSRSALLT